MSKIGATHRPFKKMLTRSEQGTMACGKRLARILRPGDVVCLEGDLGSGKTTFVKGLALGLGIRDSDLVKSPTFVVMQIYPTKPRLYHFDLYRLDTDEDISAIGFEEFTQSGKAISCIEWAEKARHLLPERTYEVRFKWIDPHTRSLNFRVP